MDFLIRLLHNLFMASDDIVFLHSASFPHCAERVDKHFEGYHSLQFMSSGKVDLYYDRQFHSLHGRCFWPAYPGPRIRFHPATNDSTWAHRYVAFTGPLVGRWSSEGLMPRSPQPAAPNVPWAKWFDDLLTLTHRPGRWEALAAINRLERIFIELARTRVSEDDKEPWIGPLLEQLESGKPFDAQAFASDAGMALSTMRRRFRQITGTPLHAHTLQSRIARARRLLSETDTPIKAVARQLGYQDIYFFSRQFHQQTGLPPAAFRRARQGKA
jgi:AraC-like DNA-binding protein